jgi:hypothetical protein
MLEGAEKQRGDERNNGNNANKSNLQSVAVLQDEDEIRE